MAIEVLQRLVRRGSHTCGEFVRASKLNGWWFCGGEKKEMREVACMRALIPGAKSYMDKGSRWTRARTALRQPTGSPRNDGRLRRIFLTRELTRERTRDQEVEAERTWRIFIKILVSAVLTIPAFANCDLPQGQVLCREAEGRTEPARHNQIIVNRKPWVGGTACESRSRGTRLDRSSLPSFLSRE